MFDSHKILGIGVDLLEIKRIEKALLRHPQLYLKILHPLEQAQYLAFSKIKQVRFLAKRFAAKEAISKALGLGLRLPMAWQNVAILNDALGKPQVGIYHELAEFLPPSQQFLISLSDEKYYVQAFVMLIQNDIN